MTTTNQGIQENNNTLPESVASILNDTIQGQAWKAMRTIGNLNGYLLYPICICTVSTTSDTIGMLASGAIFIQVIRIASAVVSFFYANYDLHHNWKEELSDKQKQELQSLYVKRISNASANLIRGIGEAFPFTIFLVILYDVKCLSASKEDKKYCSFWTDEPIGYALENSEMSAFQEAPKSIFSRKINSLGDVPIMGLYIGIVRIFAAIWDQMNTLSKFTTDRKDKKLDQRKVTQEYMNESFSNLINCTRGAGELFTISFGCIAYDYLRSTTSQEFRDQNPQIPDFIS